MQITVITQISAAWGFNKRCGAYSRKYGTKRYYDGFKRRPQISAAFLEKKISTLRYISYALCNLTFTNKLLVKGHKGLRACLRGGGGPQVGEETC